MQGKTRSQLVIGSWQDSKSKMSIAHFQHLLKNVIEFLCLNEHAKKFGLRSFDHDLASRQKERQNRKLFFIDLACLAGDIVY